MSGGVATGEEARQGRTPAASGRRSFELAVATAADSAYRWPALLALASAGARSTAATVCLLVGDGLDDAFLAAAAEIFEQAGVAFEHVPGNLDAYDELPLGSHFSRATYGRLRVVEAAAGFAPRTLYVDADTLATGDVAPLAALDLGKCIAAAVRAHGIPTCGSPNGVADYARRGIDPTAPFFNAGVMLIDNSAWNREDISARVLDELREAPESATFADQGTLNAILHGRWVELSRSWNREVVRSPAVRIGPLAVSRRSCFSLNRTRILHFFQSVKPWEVRYPPGYLTDLYRREWERFLPVPAPRTQSYRHWLRERH